MGKIDSELVEVHTMIRKIVLHGALGERFGGPFMLDVVSPAEALRALIRQVNGFRAHFRDGQYRIIRGPIERDRALDLPAIEMRLGAATELHIVPVVAGAASGLGKILAGLALVAIAIAAPYVLPAAITGIAGFTAVTSAVFSIGAALALTGVGMLLAKAPQQPPDSLDSFLFGGQLNIATQGGPVPLVYGTFIVGSVVISAGLETQQLIGGSPIFSPTSLNTQLSTQFSS